MLHRSLVLVATTLVAVLALAAPSDGAPKKHRSLGLVYGGTTAQDNPFALKLAKGAKKPAEATVFVNGTCTDGERLTIYATLSFQRSVPAFLPPGEHVLAGGRLSRRGKFRASGRGTEGFGAGTGAVSERISGTVKRNGSASGTYRATVEIVDRASGAPLTSCDTGDVAWTARSSRGRIFAGRTSQELPVVLELDSGGQSIRHLRFAWFAPCAPEGAILWGDRLSNRRMSGNSFTETFQQTSTSSDGFKELTDYDVDLSVFKAKMSGDFSVKLTVLDPAGATFATCDTGSISWSARSG